VSDKPLVPVEEIEAMANNLGQQFETMLRAYLQETLPEGQLTREQIIDACATACGCAAGGVYGTVAALLATLVDRDVLRPDDLEHLIGQWEEKQR